MCSRTNAPCLPTTTPGLSFLRLGLAARRRASSPPAKASWVGDRRKRQTSTATPAEPGDLPWVLDGSPEVVVTGTIGDGRMAQRECGRREDVGGPARIALPGEDVEDDVGGVDALGDRLCAH